MLNLILIPGLMIAEFFLVQWLIEKCEALHKSGGDDFFVNLGKPRIALLAFSAAGSVPDDPEPDSTGLQKRMRTKELHC